MGALNGKAIVIEHVRHRLSHDDTVDGRLAWTVCGQRCSYRLAWPRDTAHHAPERRQCSECYA